MATVIIHHQKRMDSEEKPTRADCNTVGSFLLEGSVDSILDQAWALTQSHNSAWFENPDFSKNPDAEPRHRSSCVGDLFEIKGYAQYKVTSFGFEEIREVA